MTGKSLAKWSLAQRIRSDTTRRPTVRLTARNANVPRTAQPTERRSIVPDEASPNEIAMMTQPMVSSRIAEATMIWPMSRRMKFISRTTIATILIEEIDSAVPRNRAVTKRDSGMRQQRIRQQRAEREAADERAAPPRRRRPPSPSGRPGAPAGGRFPCR